jgi:hypothetical protein
MAETKKRRDAAAKTKPPAAKQPVVTHRIEVVTPEIATKWLERNLSNRNVDQAVVDQYARDMRAGRWHMTGDPIQFGISGRLLNGQHRLWACFAADTPFETMVVRNLVNEVEIVDVIDTGKKRTLANAFQIHGEKDSNLLAGIVNLCWRFDSHALTGPEAPTHEEGLEYLREHPEIRDATLVARRVFTGIKATASPVGAAYHLNARVDPEAADEFWKLAATGEGLQSGSPILAWRRWVISQVAKREKPRQHVWLAYHLKAMSHWRAGKNIRLLVVKPDEPMPEPWT